MVLREAGREDWRMELAQDHMLWVGFGISVLVPSGSAATVTVFMLQI